MDAMLSHGATSAPCSRATALVRPRYRSTETIALIQPCWGRRSCFTLLLLPLIPLVAGCDLGELMLAYECARPANEIVAENCLEGHPATEWDINGYGDPSIQGFGTEIAIAQGETIEFKVDTDSDDYRIDVYRMGYYGGMGARRVDSIEPSAALPQAQPECMRGPIPVLADRR